MTSRTDFNSHTTTYTYNTMNRLTAKTADAFFATGACAPTAQNSFRCSRGAYPCDDRNIAPDTRERKE